MKYCLDWRGHNDDLLQQADEINVDLTKARDLNKENLLLFCEQYKDKRINLCIDDFETGINEGYISLALETIKESPYNIAIRLPGLNDLCNKIKEEHPECKIFFNDYITDWDKLYKYLDFGVSDIYITETMGFALQYIGPIVHEKGTQVRVFPNVTQSIHTEMDDIKKFWIRPEDIEIYEPFVDVYEFWGDPKKIATYFDIYSKDKKWAGNLKEIIIGMKQDINSNCILPRFGERRVRCEKTCLKGGPCNLCDTIFELSKNLEDNDFRIIYKKNKEEIEDGKRSSSESRSVEENSK